jgi:hypothetical protein
MGDLNLLVAAELSDNAYPDPNMALPQGWSRVGAGAFPGHSKYNSFTEFVDQSTHQVVFAFKGTDSLNNYESDFLNSGGQAWNDIESAADNQLAAARVAYAGYQIIADGHSFGGVALRRHLHCKTTWIAILKTLCRFRNLASPTS